MQSEAMLCRFLFPKSAPRTSKTMEIHRIVVKNQGFAISAQIVAWARFWTLLASPFALKNDPRAPKIRPRRLQDRPKSAQDTPKRPPRAPQERSRCLQDRSKSAQDTPKSAQEASKSAPTAPGQPQERPRRTQERPGRFQEGSRTFQDATCCPDCCPATCHKATPIMHPLRCAAVSRSVLQSAAHLPVCIGVLDCSPDFCVQTTGVKSL